MVTFEMERIRAMRRTRLLVALVLSLMAHGVIGVCTYTLMGRRPIVLIPAFQAGDAGLSVSLLTGKEDATELVAEPLPAPGVAAAPEPVATPVPEPAEILAEIPTPEDVALTVDPSDSPVGAPDPGVVVAEVRRLAPAAVESAPAGHGGAVQEAGVLGNPSATGVPSSLVGLGEIRRDYPLGARMRGEEGVVTVKVTVNARGRAEKVEVVESSSFPALDRAAVKSAKDARFVSADGSTTQGGEIVLSFRFKLVE